MVFEILFYVVILLANIMQGITGFAGTVLAMPFSIRLVGIEVARPVLNVVGLAAGIYMVIKGYKHINYKQFIKIVICMSVGVFAGMGIKTLFVGRERLMFIILGCFVIFVGAKGLIKAVLERKKLAKGVDASTHSISHTVNHNRNGKILDLITGILLILSAGIVHGMFVCGGPLLITYLTKEIKEKEEFRSTISACWIVLNCIVFIGDIMGGYYTANTVRIQCIALPFLFAGIFLGGLLVKKMSQKVFMIITYVLLVIAGASLFFK